MSNRLAQGYRGIWGVSGFATILQEAEEGEEEAEEEAEEEEESRIREPIIASKGP